jgi:hypothetical protein
MDSLFDRILFDFFSKKQPNYYTHITRPIRRRNRLLYLTADDSTSIVRGCSSLITSSYQHGGCREYPQEQASGEASELL